METSHVPAYVVVARHGSACWLCCFCQRICDSCDWATCLTARGPKKRFVVVFRAAAVSSPTIEMESSGLMESPATGAVSNAPSPRGVRTIPDDGQGDTSLHLWTLTHIICPRWPQWPQRKFRMGLELKALNDLSILSFRSESAAPGSRMVNASVLPMEGMKTLLRRPSFAS